MKRVTGIGGVFFKSPDPKRLSAWYQTHLGVPVEVWGGAAFNWAGPDNPAGTGTTVWSPVKEDAENFAPGASRFMINYRVDDLHALMAALREEGCEIVGKIDESEYGKFGWVMDPDGNKVELWQAPDGQ
jgi:predicted enzyme related to lactoylglutathione lyase